MKTVSLEVNQYLGVTWVPVLNQGMIKAGEGEGWALPFICCAQDTVGLLWTVRYSNRKPLPFFIMKINKSDYSRIK